jgi:hypothetical protein
MLSCVVVLAYSSPPSSSNCTDENWRISSHRSGVSMLYSGFMPKAKLQERLKMPYVPVFLFPSLFPFLDTDPSSLFACSLSTLVETVSKKPIPPHVKDIVRSLSPPPSRLPCLLPTLLSFTGLRAHGRLQRRGRRGAAVPQGSRSRLKAVSLLLSTIPQEQQYSLLPTSRFPSSPLLSLLSSR